MATHEREITGPVDLCLPNGRILDLAARGWSRRPWHRANLRGRWGRTKRWDYWAILSDEVAVSVTYADLDLVGIVDIWWLHHPSGETGGWSHAVPFGRGISLPDRFGSEPLRFEHDRATVELSDDPGGTTITAAWVEGDGRRASLDARVDLPEDHDSLNVVIPWSTRTFQYTSKHQARPARGTLRIGTTDHGFGSIGSDGSGGSPAWGVLDVGRGRWPYRSVWNWGSGNGIAEDGETVVGVQVGARWTEGTGFTENGIIVDGRLTKIGDELDWSYDWDSPMDPWRVRHPDGSLDLTLVPTFDRASTIDVGVFMRSVHQVFGRWSGHVTEDDGRRHEVRGILGFAEESRARW